MKRILEGLFIIGMIAVMAGVCIVPAMAAEVSPEGSFNLNNAAPEVTGVVLYESFIGNPIDTMDPQTEYAVMISISDSDKLSDLTNIVL
ncbi:MAG: hypothetical protein KKG76_05320 [Euryarchaeota archaeon]|nr:hypothetical protein [Euryarchaeota archaeon]MBU4139589.1 hypothetical protein [Euryarchaeota archaeon]